MIAEPDEVPAVVAGFFVFLLLFAAHFMLRPVRETFGVAGGVDNLQWLFLGTFIATLTLAPFYGWLSSKVARRRLLPFAYAFFALSFVGFAVSLWQSPENVWVGRAFYIWHSVFNLFVVSLAWSLMADVFNPGQAKRLFGQMAAGASLGGLAGPLMAGALVEPIGEGGLLLLAAILLLGSLLPVAYVLRWRDRRPQAQAASAESRQPIGGSIIAGLTLIFRSPYLLVISLFVLLLTAVTTFLYFEQARLVDATFQDRAQQTQVFAGIDAVVQALTIGVQIFLTGRLARRLGVTVLLTAVPIATVFAFGALAAVYTFPVLAVAMVVRRVGEYALVRPGREMLFTTVDNETKYKAKNAIDTVVYRGGDVASAWLNTALTALGSGPAVPLAGAVIAAGWAVVGFRLGRLHDRRSPEAA
ncbi:NTP/NDP exchange transporter [Phenylobacterium sp. J367]|uniref:NTP/NDP exchange transporter n=1 Tax=Phenylobacterium sp. J367 TaxID=2898435 RepID=UPI00215148F1|nr:MFS transporter [Phenylobacterium sp. J367]MCR5877945.1 MFS transporter [Phenylobacterium sp. J367]